MSFRRTSNTSDAEIKLYLSFDIKDVYPTEGDMLYALERQKTRILTRTARGVDFQERTFAPYNTTRPYYYYPSGPVGRIRSTGEKSRAKAGVKRFAGKLGRTKSAISRSGLGLKFPSYAAFKFDYLGRQNVDLTGPRAPHMLQSIVSEAGGSTFFQSVNPGLNAFPNQALTGSIGIYGDPGIRAGAHNEGTRYLPQRQFFASSDKDNTAFGNDLKTRVQNRLNVKYGSRSFYEPTAA
jgi:hypothetical protein